MFRQLLDLSNNSLEEVSADALYRTWNVTHLFLNDNKLRQIDEHLTKRLAKLQLVRKETKNGFIQKLLTQCSTLFNLKAHNSFAEVKCKWKYVGKWKWKRKWKNHSELNTLEINCFFPPKTSSFVSFK